MYVRVLNVKAHWIQNFLVLLGFFYRNKKDRTVLIFSSFSRKKPSRASLPRKTNENVTIKQNSHYKWFRKCRILFGIICRLIFYLCDSHMRSSWSYYCLFFTFLYFSLCFFETHFSHFSHHFYDLSEKLLQFIRNYFLNVQNSNNFFHD